MTQEELNKIMLRKARVQSIILAVAAIISVIFMIYGFTQSIEAARQKDLATKYIQIKDAEIRSLKDQLNRCKSEGK